eukprot:CAMPEP_0181109834 /NCGR_PEP_ID=MMETSP1071-20121207/18387_1 /TAXON_ID=35127 /ORGANISM="Thalassiosira sp., Strain NH16" /LENGTH=936 /DNA_ID=CAMNT_0023193555 /DNA_START=179 /DNA_END=2989 /DNA_ORIENTATION=-
MSLEDLKRETAQRLSHEGGQLDGGGGDESSENAGVDGLCVVEHSQSISNMHYQHPHYPQGHQHPREAVVSAHYGPHIMTSPPNNQYPQRGSGGRVSAGDYGPQTFGYNDLPNNYSNESRNYTDSQLGVGGVIPGNGQGNMATQFTSPPPPPPPYRSSSQQQYSTPRMPRHATVLKDRGSAENSVGSDPSGGSDVMGYGYGGHRVNAKASAPSPAVKGNNRPVLHSKTLNKSGGKGASGSPKPPPMETRSPDGKLTPIRDRNILGDRILEGQVLFATPSRREVGSSAPTSVYSEPPRSKAGGNHRPRPTMSPNYNRGMRSPEHYSGNYSSGGVGGGPYSQGKNQLNKHHSKLPHGLTVQELKEMTRARLAAEAEISGPEQGGSSDQSVHSAGTQTSSKGSDQFSSSRGSNLAQQSNESVTRNHVQSSESIRRDYSNQGLNSQSFQSKLQQIPLPQQHNAPPQYNNYTRHSSPVFGASAQSQFNSNQAPPPVVPRQLSPAFGLSSSQTRSQMQGDTWETASAASSTLASEYQVPIDSAFHTGKNGGGGGAANMPFSSPISDSNAMTFNRGRCFSAGATTGITSSMPPPFEQHQHLAYHTSYYDNVAPTGVANRQRCATVSPPGMSRLHEDRPFLFSSSDKERLAIPPLSEPRLRLHSTGGLNTNGTAVRAFNSGMSSPPSTANGCSGSAFVPTGKTPSGERFMPTSPPPPRVDRSKFGVGDRTISTGSAGHGDLPSSMAEAVLESISSTGAPMGSIGGQVIGMSPFRSSEQEFVGESPFRVSDSSENTSSAFRLDGLLPESSGSMSLFSSGESRNIFSAENSGERILMGTHSWGGTEDETTHSNMCLGHDFGNLLNLSGGGNYGGQPARGRAATEPVWFGGNDRNDPQLVSRIDPEHNAEQHRKAPPRVSSLVDTSINAPCNNFTLRDSQQGRPSDGS